jgi:hypothetical protein
VQNEAPTEPVQYAIYLALSSLCDSGGDKTVRLGNVDNNRRQIDFGIKTVIRSGRVHIFLPEMSFWEISDELDSMGLALRQSTNP